MTAPSILLTPDIITLIDAKTDADATGIGVLPATLCKKGVEATYYVVFDGTAGAGTVVIESAHDRNYDGTWANLGTVNWAAASKCHKVAVTGLDGAVRARITSAITSGTVSVYVLYATNS